jgi:DNA-binding beta-propeller fold protein YncE
MLRARGQTCRRAARIPQRDEVDLMRTGLLLAVSFLAAAVLDAPAFSQQTDPGFAVTRRIPIGGEGGWDYLTPEPATGRLFVTHGTHVVVLDSQSGRILGDIADTPRVHGVALIESLNRGFTTNGGDASVTMFELGSLEVMRRIKIAGQNPDAILYEPATGRLFTFNGASADATAIDPQTGDVIGTIPLGGKPETGVDDGNGHVYVNIEDRSELKRFDPQTLEVNATWSLAPCEEPTGLAMDQQTRRLFVGCSNKLMTVVDADTGQVVTTLPVGDGVDGVKFDPSLKLVFVSAGEGTLTVVHEKDANSFEVQQNVPTLRGARTLAVDPTRHEVYLSTAEVDTSKPPRPDDPRHRPQYLPGSFMVLVVSRAPAA